LLNNTKKQFKKEDLKREIHNRCNILFDKNYREMGIRLIKFDGEKGILRCNHIEKENAITLLKSIKEIDSEIVNFETVGTSGTIKSLMKKHM